MVQVYGLVKSYDRRGVVTIPTVSRLALAATGKDPRASICGVNVKVGSARYKMFAKNHFCVKCGLEGEYYAVERAIKRTADGNWHPTSVGYHMNLYGRRDGREVLFTKDHIIPKSKGGPDVDWNYETMCAPCNTAKGDRRD